MDCIISDIRIRIPGELLRGHFSKALEVFAVPDAAAPVALLLEPGECLTAAENYRELDAFDFSDADALCRFGRDRDGYLLEMAPRDGSPSARFRIRTASSPSAAVPAPVRAVTDFSAERHLPALLRFGLWTAFNLAALGRGAVAVHTSVNVYRGGAVLFLGESGTGKSTHTRLWREHIEGVKLLNDDSPIVSVSGDKALVSGSPWSGKTPCYIAESYPIRAIVRLSQAPHNRIRRLSALEAIGALLPSCPPAFARDEKLQDAVCRILSDVLGRVPAYHLECLPDAAAARLSCATIFGNDV